MAGVTELQPTQLYQPHHFGLFSKALVLGGCAIVAVIVNTVGWSALAPADPAGAVTLLGSRAAWPVLWLELLALSAVGSALATIVAGRRFRDVGILSVGIAISIAGLRGAPSSYLLVMAADGVAPYSSALALRLALESLVWCTVMAAALLSGGAIGSWVGVYTRGPRTGLDDSPPDEACPAAFDIPCLGPRLSHPIETPRTDPKTGLRHTMLVIGAAFVCMAILGAGPGPHEVRHGQACFTVAASFWLAMLLAYRLVPVHSSLWSLLAIPAVTLLAYLWSAAWSGAGQTPPNIPASFFLRILPIEFVGVSAAVVVLTADSLRHSLAMNELPQTGRAGARASRAGNAR